MVLDDPSHAPSHPPLAPMEVDKLLPMREHPNAFPPPPGHDLGPCSPAVQGIHHSRLQLQGLFELHRYAPEPPLHTHAMRVPSASASPLPHVRPQSPRISGEVYITQAQKVSTPSALSHLPLFEYRLPPFHIRALYAYTVLALTTHLPSTP